MLARFLRELLGSSDGPDLLSDQLCNGEMLPGNVTLVIVHVQRWYGHSIDEAMLQSVQAMIELAKKRGWAIILSSQNFPPQFGIYKEVTDLVAGYSGFRPCHATDTDGSQPIKRVCDRKRSRHFIVVGVYANACVRATVQGLLRRFPRSTVRVIKEACRDHWSDRGINWGWYPQHPRLAISSADVLCALRERT